MTKVQAMVCWSIANYTSDAWMVEQHWLSMLHCFAHLPSADSQGDAFLWAKHVAGTAWSAASDGEAETFY